jgi:pyroglutamyl-peptidase
LPIKSIVSRLQENGIPAHISNSAGTFVCNHLMYGVLHFISQENWATKAGFIHVPYLPEQAAKKPDLVSSMSLETMVNGVILAIETVVESIEREQK